MRTVLLKGSMLLHRIYKYHSLDYITIEQWVRFHAMAIQAQENMIKELVNSKISDL